MQIKQNYGKKQVGSSISRSKSSLVDIDYRETNNS